MPGEVSIIFPAYNEAENILPLIDKTRQVLPHYFQEWEIIVVDDGSTDATRDIVEKLSESEGRIRIISHERNMGYGAALRSGFNSAQFNLIFFCDADGQFDIGEIELLLPYVENADIVAGFRIKRADCLHRILNAWLYNRLVRTVFGIKVRDVNCAFKFIKRYVLENISLESNGALINAELLYKAKRKGFNTKEVGVHHYPRKRGTQTGARLKVVLRMFLELLRWRIRWAGIDSPGRKR